MSDIKYGLISKTDAAVLEKTIDLIIADFPNQPIKVLELGIYSGETGNGIRQYIESKARECELTGVDSGADGQQLLFSKAYNTIIEMPTTAAAYLLPDNNFHLCFVDANHSYAAVIADFYCYKGKVKYDGFIAFHDSAPHIAPFTHWQKTGDPEDADQYISCRKALKEMNLFRKFWSSNGETGEIKEKNGFVGADNVEWELVFDEADTENDAGGICCFRKIY